ncbi:MAG: hypothetical protein WD200_04110 [Candidatus Andersenbacteria bacterium]
MTSALLKTLMKAGIYLGISEFLLKGKTQEYRIKNVVLGIVLLLLAGLIGFLGFAGVLAAIFFGLADLDTFIRPAVLAALLAFALALLLLWEGVRRMKAKLGR